MTGEDIEMTPARKPVKSSKRSPKGKAADVRANPPVGRRGKSVRPLEAKPAMGKKYDYGFRMPPEKSPWRDEGHPEVNG
jgi:hypothetical protein